jgi:hypothetical protein
MSENSTIVAELEPATKRKYEEYLGKGLSHDAALLRATEETEVFLALKYTRDLRATHKMGGPPSLFKGEDPTENRYNTYIKRHQAAH